MCRIYKIKENKMVRKHPHVNSVEQSTTNDFAGCVILAIQWANNTQCAVRHREGRGGGKRDG